MYHNSGGDSGKSLCTRLLNLRMELVTLCIWVALQMCSARNSFYRRRVMSCMKLHDDAEIISPQFWRFGIFS